LPSSSRPLIDELARKVGDLHPRIPRKASNGNRTSITGLYGVREDNQFISRSGGSTIAIANDTEFGAEVDHTGIGINGDITYNVVQ